MNYSFIRKHVTRPSFALVFVVIVLVAGTIYSNIYQCPFVFDDLLQIEDKVIIRDLANYFSLEAFLKSRPIGDLTFALNYRFGQLTVFGYHLVNVLIHIINGFLVYFLALTIFKQLLSGSTQRFDESSKLEARSSKDNPKHKTSNILLSDGSAGSNSFQSSIINHQSSILLMALFAALIFIAHPIQTQAVTYTIQRYASLAAMFYMGSVLFYLKARVRQRRSEIRGQRSEIRGQRSEIRGQRWEIRGQRSEIRGQRSEIRGQRSEIRGQRSEIRGQRSEIRGHSGEMRSAVVNEFHRAGRSEGGRAFSFQISAYFVLSILCGVLAFLSKQNTASLPAAIILVEYLFIDRTWQGWKKKILWFTPIFILFVIFVLYVSGFFSGGHEGRGLLEDVSDLMQETETVSRWSYLCTQFNVLVIYIRLLFLPIGQNLDYVYPFKSGFFDAYTPLAFLFLTGLAAIGIWNRKKQPIITFGIFWFFITLSVESGIIPIRDALFEHRLYLPMFGFALIVSYLLFHLLSKRRLWAIVISISIIVSLGTATYLRNMIWHDGITLWSDVVSKNPENHRGHYNLGNALERQGSLKEAISHYSEALKVEPKYAMAHSNLGLVLMQQGRLDDANRHFFEALQVRPEDEKTHNNLGISLMRQGNLKEATKHFSEALRIKPDYAPAHNSLGIILVQQGRLDDANRHFFEALRVRPEDAKIHNNLGISLMRQGNLKEATKHFSEALRIKPDYGKARRNLESIRRYIRKTR